MPSTPSVVEGGLLAKAYIGATAVCWHCPYREQLFIKQQTNRLLLHATVLAMGSGQWAVGSGQWAIGNWQLAIGNWQLAVERGLHNSLWERSEVTRAAICRAAAAAVEPANAICLTKPKCQVYDCCAADRPSADQGKRAPTADGQNQKLIGTAAGLLRNSNANHQAPGGLHNPWPNI